MVYILSAKYALPKPKPVFILPAKFALPEPKQFCTANDLEKPAEEQAIPTIEQEEEKVEINSDLKKLFMMFSKPTMAMLMHFRPLYVKARLNGQNVNKIMVGEETGFIKAQVSLQELLMWNPVTDEAELIKADPRPFSVSANAKMIRENGSPSSQKKIQREWSCPLCQITTTSENCLKMHFQGKKHALKVPENKYGSPTSQKKIQTEWTVDWNRKLTTTNVKI
ncbi:hypothetical protein ACLB2K_053394 [Fragaria x ananassa]